MKKLVLITVVISIAAALLWSCSSESQETQQLYLDAKAMYDEINAAFAMPGNTPQRANAMKEIILKDKDLKVVSNLEEYLREAPNGKYAKQAKALLDDVKQNMNIRMLGQLRPMMQQTGGATKEDQLDSLMHAKPKVPSDS